MLPSWGPAAVATAVAWAGALLAGWLRQSGTRMMRPLVYAALLFFGLSAVFDILPQSKHALGWPAFAASVAVGYGICWAIGRFVAPICPACAFRTVEHDHHHAHGAGLTVLAVVLAIHCVMDGLGVTAAASMQGSLGTRVLAATALHKLPEGFALALMMILGSHAAWRAVMTAMLVELATLAGGALDLLWARPSPFWLAVILAAIGGTFLYLCVSGFLEALLPPTGRPPAAPPDRHRHTTALRVERAHRSRHAL
jgi:zinc transporter ZupT